MIALRVLSRSSCEMKASHQVSVAWARRELINMTLMQPRRLDYHCGTRVERRLAPIQRQCSVCGAQPTDDSFEETRFFAHLFVDHVESVAVDRASGCCWRRTAGTRYEWARCARRVRFDKAFEDGSGRTADIDKGLRRRYYLNHFENKIAVESRPAVLEIH